MPLQIIFLQHIVEIFFISFIHLFIQSHGYSKLAMARFDPAACEKSSISWIERWREIPYKDRNHLKTQRGVASNSKETDGKT